MVLPLSCRLACGQPMMTSTHASTWHVHRTRYHEHLLASGTGAGKSFISYACCSPLVCSRGGDNVMERHRAPETNEEERSNQAPHGKKSSINPGCSMPAYPLPSGWSKCVRVFRQTLECIELFCNLSRVCNRKHQQQHSAIINLKHVDP
jgi:hypothetical protein